MQIVKINGEDKDFPTSVEDLTLKQFFDLRLCKDLIDEISVLSGIDREQILNFKDLKTIEAAHVLTGMVSQSIIKGFDHITLPKHVMLGDKKIRVPKELRLQPIGAFMNVSHLLTKHDELMAADATKVGNLSIDYTICVPKTLAHYFYLPYYGEDALYSEDKAESDEFMDLIYGMRLVDAIPIANFFFLKYPNLA